MKLDKAPYKTNHERGTDAINEDIKFSAENRRRDVKARTNFIDRIDDTKREDIAQHISLRKYLLDDTQH